MSNFQFGEEVIQQYKNDDNYLIVETKNDIKIERYCVIYFSSNGIYYPTTKEVFEKEIVRNNKFEMYKSRIKNAQKHIFLRDIFKQWYIKGINERINSIDKIVEFLRKETDGYKIITIGSSSGGYIATIIGILLNAEYVLNFCGQFSLNEKNSCFNFFDKELNPFLVEKRNMDNKYFDLSNLLSGSNVPIFYFVSTKSKEDDFQLKMAYNYENINIVKINSDIHGVPFYDFNFCDLINNSKSKLFWIKKVIKNKEVKPIYFSFLVSGILKTNFYIIRKIKNKINNIIFIKN